MAELPLLDSILRLPKASVTQHADAAVASLQSLVQHDETTRSRLNTLLEHPMGLPLLHAIFGNSPYLSKLILLQLPFFLQLCETSPDEAFESAMAQLRDQSPAQLTHAETMKALRVGKQQIALLCAIADIGSIWDVMNVTKHLALFADLAVSKATDFLLSKAAQQGEITLQAPQNPQTGSGLLILAMGKMGAYELNYSSDIDLIILFDKERATYCGPRNVQYFFTKFAQDLASLLQERTSDGYVFRTDLRLRPDPRSTPPAMNVHSAIAYYESLGQNWERAAMIKARQIAGDPKTGELFDEHMTPYIWRKHLDFASIADIHSIKRQMTTKAGEAMAVGGHNIKLGRGGIREIEFYVQTQQLVWGGRYPELRCRSTLEALQRLVDTDIIAQEKADSLTDAYLFLRRVEHYLQMQEDQQTHRLPDTDEDLRKTAVFLGYNGIFDFTKELLYYCSEVHQIYSDSMEGTPPLSMEGNLVFTGVDADPETLQTLSKMGYSNTEAISDIIQNWHRGSRRATRSKRARQILTELIPALLKALGNTVNPDTAFFRFDDFLSKLPAGVQIFSLFHARPELLDLIARILGSAPALADIMGKYPLLLDSVLQGDFYEALPDREMLEAQLAHKLEYMRDYEEALRELRVFKNERQFQAGMQMLQGIADPDAIGVFLSELAEVITAQVVQLAIAEFAHTHGHISNSWLAVIALGKLGSKELTFGSDLDLIFVYDSDDSNNQSDGEKSVDISTYYTRLCSRIITAFTMMAKEGTLYEVDTRLRPSGGDSSLATRFTAFEKYFSESAWVFEFMALTKARVIYATQPQSKTMLSETVTTHLQREHDIAHLAEEVIDMRQKIAKQYHTLNPWHIKHVRGGLIDADFLAQYLVLRHAANEPQMIESSTRRIFEQAKQLGILSDTIADDLIDAHHLLSALLSFLRLCSDGTIIEEVAPVGLKHLLLTRFSTETFEQLREKLIKSESKIAYYFDRLKEL